MDVTSEQHSGQYILCEHVYYDWCR